MAIGRLIIVMKMGIAYHLHDTRVFAIHQTMPDYCLGLYTCTAAFFEELSGNVHYAVNVLF